MVGLPGVILAVVIWLNIKEPPRGYSDPPVAAVLTTRPRSGLWSELKEIGAVVRALFLQWPVLNMTLGVTITSFGSYGSGAFVPQFVYTTFPLSLGLTGLLVGLVMQGFSAAIGTLAGGFLTDRLARRSPVWYSLIPAFGLLIAAPLFVFAFTQPDWRLMFVLLLFPGIFLSTYLAPTFAVVQNAVPAYRRATATAILFFFLNLIALGGGPVFAGTLVDYYATNAYAHPGVHDVWGPLGGALAHAAGATLMAYAGIVTGLIDLAKGMFGAASHVIAAPHAAAGAFVTDCPGGRAPAKAGAAAAAACKSALSWGSQQGVLIGVCFYLWASVHYFLGGIGLTRLLRRQVAI